MKTTLGGDRLGSGNKQKISMKSYNRSTHDLSYIWRSSMSAGTLVPFMNKVAQPGDSFDIDLEAEVLTLPTIGPLFGSFKVQLDVFQVPIRLYNAQLHMNKLGIGMNMSNVYLPQIKVNARNSSLLSDQENKFNDNIQINSSCLLKYLGISGIGNMTNNTEDIGQRRFNGVPILGYWDIYKNYYSNKQEERGFGIHIDNDTIAARQAILSAKLYVDETYIGEALDNELIASPQGTMTLVLKFGERAIQPNVGDITIIVGGNNETGLDFGVRSWDEDSKTWLLGADNPDGLTIEVPPQSPTSVIVPTDLSPSLVEFDLENIDKMRERVLQATGAYPFTVNDSGHEAPYNWITGAIVDDGKVKGYSVEYSQAMLGIKTYQSDLFNNWISTDWIDGTNGINEVTAVDTTGDSFTIDALNLSQKVYNMLNRIAISGGSYDDWLDAVYTHERAKSIESPVYMGSLIRELAFQSVVSNAESETDSQNQPLGTLAGRGVMTGKRKGGKVKIKVDEPSYIMGIVSLTPRIDYSQGNAWDVNLETMNDFHKPALDAIGFQELITEQMAWQSSEVNWNGTSSTVTTKSAGKQPAWINYMTAVNKTYGNFAEENKEMFMTLNRKYEIDQATGAIADLTTYIDPTKDNQIFAQTNLEAQNFWVQIKADVTARRKMSAKIIPNL